jgi:hypothetical protein
MISDIFTALAMLRPQMEPGNFVFEELIVFSSQTLLRTPGLSRVKDGLLITEVDLNLCQ